MVSVEDHALVHATAIEADHAIEDDVPDHAHDPEVVHDHETNVDARDLVLAHDLAVMTLAQNRDLDPAAALARGPVEYHSIDIFCPVDANSQLASLGLLESLKIETILPLNFICHQN